MDADSNANEREQLGDVRRAFRFEWKQETYLRSGDEDQDPAAAFHWVASGFSPLKDSKLDSVAVDDAAVSPLWYTATASTITAITQPSSTTRAPSTIHTEDDNTLEGSVDSGSFLTRTRKRKPSSYPEYSTGNRNYGTGIFRSAFR